MSLGFQNATVVLCATFLCMVMMFETQLKTNIHDAWIEIAGQGLVVAMAVLSRLGSLANIICVEKDWLIVLAHGSREKLAGESGTVSQERRLHGHRFNHGSRSKSKHFKIVRSDERYCPSNRYGIEAPGPSICGPDHGEVLGIGSRIPCSVESRQRIPRVPTFAGSLCERSRPRHEIPIPRSM